MIWFYLTVVFLGGAAFSWGMVERGKREDKRRQYLLKQSAMQEAIKNRENY